MSRRRFKRFGQVLVAVALLAAAGAAWAEGSRLRQVHGTGFRQGHVHAHGHRHGHFHGGARVGIGIQLGSGFVYPSYPYYPYYPYHSYYPYYLGYYPGYYYGPAVVTVPSSPPQYIERGEELPGDEAPAPAYWYRCARPEGYYPYVTHCPGGWQRVPAQPPAR